MGHRPACPLPGAPTGEGLACSRTPALPWLVLFWWSGPRGRRGTRSPCADSRRPVSLQAGCWGLTPPSRGLATARSQQGSRDGGPRGPRGPCRQGLLCTCRRTVPAVAPEPEMDAAPGPDLLGSILSGQSFLLMDSADVTIHRDGSLSAKRAGEAERQGRPRPSSRGSAAPRRPAPRAARASGCRLSVAAVPCGSALRRRGGAVQLHDVPPLPAPCTST